MFRFPQTVVSSSLLLIRLRTGTRPGANSKGRCPMQRLCRRSASLVAAVTLCCSGLALAQEGATLVSDKQDYEPGEIAILTGAGFWSYELVDVSLSIDDPETGQHIADYDWTIEDADGDGAFITYFEVPEDAVGTFLTANALGLQSGLVATATFTDQWWYSTRIRNVGPSSGACGSQIWATAKLEYWWWGWRPLSGRFVEFDLGSADGWDFTDSNGNADAVLTVPEGATSLVASFDGDYPYRSSSSSIGFTVTGSCCTEVNHAPWFSYLHNRDWGTMCTPDGSWTGSVSVFHFGPGTYDPDGDPVAVTFDDGTSSRVITLHGRHDHVWMLVKATDDPQARNQAGCPPLQPMSDYQWVYVEADVWTQPTNTAPTLSATDLSLGDIIPPYWPVTVTVYPSDFGPQTWDPDNDQVTVTFSDGTTSREITLSADYQSHMVQLKATDNGSARNVGYPCYTIYNMSTYYSVLVSGSVHSCPANEGPTVNASVYEVGPFNVTSGCEVPVGILPSDFIPGYADPESDPQSGDFWLSTDVVTLNAAGGWTATATLSAMDDPSGRNDPLCYDLEPMIGSTVVTVQGTVQVLTNAAPEIEASDYEAGDFCVDDSGSVTISGLAPGTFGASAADADGDAIGPLILDTSNVTLTLAAGQSDAEVEAEVLLSATDDPSARSATLFDPDCNPLTPMTGTKTVKVRATLHRNQPPVITASDYVLPDQVGTLLDGSFQKTVSVSLASFGASANDPDGDPVPTLVASDSSVTLVGPGLAEATVTLTATDDCSARTAGTCENQSSSVQVKVEARVVYDYVGFLPPLSNTTTRTVKCGSTVPVKFQLFDADNVAITTGTHTIAVDLQQANAPDQETQIDNPGDSGDDNDTFRWSSPNWIFNLKTDDTYTVGWTYKIRAFLADGTTRDCCISIK